VDPTAVCAPSEPRIRTIGIRTIGRGQKNISGATPDVSAATFLAFLQNVAKPKGDISTAPDHLLGYRGKISKGRDDRAKDFLNLSLITFSTSPLASGASAFRKHVRCKTEHAATARDHTGQSQSPDVGVADSFGGPSTTRAIPPR
jgi:hypothetical protein